MPAGTIIFHGILFSLGGNPVFGNLGTDVIVVVGGDTVVVVLEGGTVLVVVVVGANCAGT